LWNRRGVRRERTAVDRRSFVEQGHVTKPTEDEKPTRPQRDHRVVDAAGIDIEFEGVAALTPLGIKEAAVESQNASQLQAPSTRLPTMAN
jgi:hypothetical protein